MELKALLLAVGLLAATSAGLLSRPPPRPTATVGFQSLPSANFLNIVARSQRMLVATFYWLRLIHISGDVRSAPEGLFLYQLGELVTDVDPRYYLPYWYSALNVPFRLDRNWLNAPLATALLEKGLRAYPSDTKLTLFLAQNELLYNGNRLKAGQLMREIANRPGVPAFVGPLAARILAHEGEFSAALEFAKQMEAAATDDEVRETFAKRSKEIVLEARLTDVDKAAAAFKAREGQAAISLEELVTAGDLRSIPEDPLGGRIFLGEDGAAHSTLAPKRLRLFDDARDPMGF